ncbi:hypothetical protein V476_21830 [Pseudomonas syringae KCTC 12500]|nr:hypothetical protein V476_21830 [Pseudomonas syringae KCTC 12500]POR85142.1 hypothetical protein BKM21_14060 [Pseudomonas syringae pv. syringae]
MPTKQSRWVIRVAVLLSQTRYAESIQRFAYPAHLIQLSTIPSLNSPKIRRVSCSRHVACHDALANTVN